MITILQNQADPTILNCRPVQRTNQVSTDLINRSKNIYLIYFRCDMTGRVAYAYSEDIADYGTKRSNYQYSDLAVTQVSKVSQQNVYGTGGGGSVCFSPAGSWYYIIYEVNFPFSTAIEFLGAPFTLISSGFAPINNVGYYDSVPKPSPDPKYKGVLGLAVEEGKIEVTGGDEITYTQHEQTNDNYIYTQ
jgi:hypothetical protein